MITVCLYCKNHEKGHEIVWFRPPVRNTFLKYAPTILWHVWDTFSEKLNTSGGGASEWTVYYFSVSITQPSFKTSLALKYIDLFYQYMTFSKTESRSRSKWYFCSHAAKFRITRNVVGMLCYAYIVIHINLKVIQKVQSKFGYIHSIYAKISELQRPKTVDSVKFCQSTRAIENQNWFKKAANIEWTSNMLNQNWT